MKEVEVIKASTGSVARRRSISGEGVKIERNRVAAYARVSTDEEEQLGSFQSQIQYYKDKIKQNKEWVFAGIYSDEAITGTQSNKRDGFQQMIQDCMDGKIDMILTKSISRFARNTVDTLTYVRMLKDRQIAVVFENENINTLSMNGELLLTILSSIAQQDVETISANVKMGLKMKMKRGELIGYNGSLGYDYHPEDKSITVNEKEAETVRLIFDLYLQGYGAYTIAKQLTAMGIPNKKGEAKWGDSGIRGIIKNEKYKGDALLGKTFTVDPINKRRIENFGEEDQFYIKNHHEPIISQRIGIKHRRFECHEPTRHSLVQMVSGKNICANMHLAVCVNVDFVERSLQEEHFIAVPLMRNPCGIVEQQQIKEKIYVLIVNQLMKQLFKVHFWKHIDF